MAKSRFSTLLQFYCVTNHVITQLLNIVIYLLFYFFPFGFKYSLIYYLMSHSRPKNVPPPRLQPRKSPISISTQPKRPNLHHPRRTQVRPSHLLRTVPLSLPNTTNPPRPPPHIPSPSPESPPTPRNLHNANHPKPALLPFINPNRLMPVPTNTFPRAKRSALSTPAPQRNNTSSPIQYDTTTPTLNLATSPLYTKTTH